MDTSADVAVSLDELTVEFIEGDSLKQDKISEESGDKNSTDVTELDYYNPNAQISSAMDLDGNECFIAKELVQIDIRDDVPVHYGTDMKNTASQGRNTFIQALDYDSDIASLSVFENSKANTSDDSDFEFEVPERPVAPPSVTASSVQPVKTDAELASSKMSSAKQYLESNVNINTHLTSVCSSQFQPEILASYGNVSADLTPFHTNSDTLLMSTDQNTLLNHQSNNPDFSKTDSVADTSSMTTGIDVKDDQKLFQDRSPKSEPVLKNIQQKLSESVIQQNMTFTASMTTGDVRNDVEEPTRPSLVTTAEDWEEIQTVEPGFLQSSDRLASPASVIQLKPLASFPDVWALFKTADYSSVKAQVKTHIERHGFSALTHMIFGPPKLHRDLLTERELIFCIAATPFDNENETHIRVLQTIYRCLTGSRFDCQRFGGHWEEIGFQGKDPATDLRGTGMLALLHLLNFLQSSSTKDLARDVYKLSLHPTQNFPFCLMSINLSRICLQVLREDVLNKECNTRRGVTSTVNNVHAAIFLRLYREWKKGKTIGDSGFVLQEIETYCRKHSKNVFKDLEAYEQTRKQQGSSRRDSDAEPSFFNVCKEDQIDRKSHAELY